MIELESIANHFMDVDLQQIIQGGAVGIAVLLIAYMAWKDKLNAEKDRRYNKTLNNHLKHIDKNLNFVGKELQRANDNHNNLTSVLERNTAAFTEVQSVLQTMLEKLLK